MAAQRWSPGETVALRYFMRGKLWSAVPVRVVDDSDEVIALFLRANTAVMWPWTSSGYAGGRAASYEDRFPATWTFREARWKENSVLMLARPGASHSFWAFWTDVGWAFHAWYVNIQAPLVRTPIGFDSEDLVLDLVIEPELSSWEWKDEDELIQAVHSGRFTDEDAKRIRAEGLSAIDALRSRDWPFNRGWEDWRPEPTWTLPQLVAGWDETSNSATGGGSPLAE